MLDLRTLDPDRQTADRRVALTAFFGGLTFLTFCAAVVGAAWAPVTGFVLALAGLPWLFAFSGRWRLLGDGVAGGPFLWRGERAGVWATAPPAGALLTLLLVAALGLPTF